MPKVIEVMVVAMAKVEIIKENRFKRWSRLKSESGLGEAEQVSDTSAATIETQEGYVAPDPNGMPGGSAIRRGATVPAMPSLITEKDDEITEKDRDIELDLSAVMAEAKTEEPELTPEEQEIVSQLPAIESLTKDSDFTQFLSEKVPEFIRRRALTVLWRSDPVLANLDGLNDYDENFRIIDTLISAADDTVYRVGKGHLKNEELEAESEIEAEAREEQEAESELEPEAPSETATLGHKAENKEIVVDAHEESGENLDKKETEILISSSIRKPKNPV